MGPSRDDDDSGAMRGSDDRSALHSATSPRRRCSSAATPSPVDERDDTRSSNTNVTSSRKTLPPFVDSDETFHFFSDDTVLRTNAIRIVDDASAGASTDQHTTTQRRGGASARNTRATDDRDDDDGDDYNEDDDDECYSDEYYDDDDDYDDEADDEQRRRNARHESESDDDDAGRHALKARKSTKRLRLRPSEWSSALPTRNSLRSERIPDLAPRYDDVFAAFDDLSDVADASRLTDQRAHDRTQQERKRSHSAQSAVATYVRRAHAAKSYRYRKQCEFLRVCYQRALETEPLLDDADASASAVDATAAAAPRPESDEPRTPAPAQTTALLRATRSEEVVETTVPTLHPRKWPHLPFRSPLLWCDSIDDAVAFLTHLADLPDASLQYEPVDIDAFVRDVHALLRSVNVTEASGNEHSAPLPEAAVAGLTALLGMGVQLQSFALLSSAALQLLELGKTTRLDDASAIRPSLKSVLDVYWRRLAAQSARQAFAATYSRGLVAQWKISASPPSTSDAIATDGRYLYVFGRMGLFKIGTGNGDTVRDFVYAHNRTYTRARDAERSWLCCIGAYLYCRTIMMPSNRVDRIAVDALERVDELYFSPNRSVGVKGVSESSVYAMVTDGTHLYTIRCVDTLKRSAAQAKASSERTSKIPAPPVPLSDKMLKASSSDAQRSSEADATIQVGDRVVRGPDWKWGSQDGVEGSVGTVERVSTWGGVPGSGVTVRWDKSQRVNTYRWGAESCYDLVIVTDNNGTVLERKDLPTKQTSSKAASAASKTSADAPLLPRHQFVLFQHDVSRIGATMDIDEDDLDVFLDLSAFGADDTSAGAGASGAPSTALGDTALISALHSHAVSLCDWKSSWMCDGGLATCSGNNAAKRYRCDSGCDFDLCDACLRGTLIAKETEATDASSGDAAPVADAAAPDAPANSDASASSEAASPHDGAATDAPSPDTDAQAPSDGSSSPSSPSNLESNPFAIFHASLFYDDASSSSTGDGATALSLPSLERVASESGASTPAAPSEPAPAETPDAPASATAPTESSAVTTSASDAPAEAKEKTPQEQEQDLVAELFAFWGGLYTRKECLVALRRTSFSLNDAAIWISQCASDLRKQLLVPTVASVTLTAAPGTSALDPVLLVAGSFYMSSGQLCIVAPPGLFTVGEHQSEKLKRAVTSYDAAWFFSIETGAMLSDDRDDALPVFLRGIPAGSPTCVDSASSQIFVYSGYLNCLEVYVDPAQRVAQSCVERSLTARTTASTLSSMGEHLFAQLHLLMLQRWSLPAYKHARAGLQEILFRTEREPTPAGGSSSKPPASGADTSAYSSSGHKSKARRIKNIRGRIQTLEATGKRDPPGYFVPFAIDFRDDSVVHLFRALVASDARLRAPSTRDDDSSQRWRLVHDVLCLLLELSSELDFASVGLASEPSDAAVKTLFARAEDVLTALARGDCGRSAPASSDAALLRSKVIATAQALLAWGIRKSVFCREKKARMVVELGERIVSTLERDSMLFVAPARFASAAAPAAQCGGRLLEFASARDCEYSLLETLLRCPMDAGRVDVADFVPLDFDEFARMLAMLFKLAALEVDGAVRSAPPRHARRVNQLTAVTKALHSLMNYCSVRLYSDRDESFESKAKAKESARVSPSELFNAFALACVRACAELLAAYSAHPPSASASAGTALAHLEASVVGTILPVVLTTVSNYPAAVSVKVRHGLVELLQALDTAQTRAAVDAPADAHFECDHVVESPHPYSQTQSSFRRVVRIPGARVLHIDFDPRSCTSGEADFVLITSGRSWFNSDRVAFGDSGIGDNGGCFFGSFTHGNWPTQGLSIVGDTATILLCATSQARDTNSATQSAKLRWGLRCTVRGLVAPAAASWLHDVSSSVASACSVIAEHLVQSVAVQPVEVQCRKWLTSRELFRALDRSSALEVRKAVERRSDVVQTLGAVARLHKAPSTSTNAKWTDALGFAAAALVAQTDRAAIASVVARLTAGASPTGAGADDSVQRAVQAIATELQRVEQWMLRHVQLRNEWHYLQLDSVSVDEMKERYVDNHDRLRELCELQSVAFHSADANSSIARLHAALVSHAAKAKDDASAQSLSAYEVVATEVMEKAQLLLARYVREKALSDATSSDEDTASRSTAREHELVTTAGDFFRSTVAASALSDCAQIQSRRLRDRIAGFSLSESVVAALASTELASYFVGRAMVALSNASASETDYLSGCALGDASLLVEFEALLRKRHASAARLANDASKSLVLRAIAVADALWSAPSAASDRINKDIADGLAGTAALIRAADAALARASARSDSIHCQTSNAVWILHRLMQEHGIRALDAAGGDPSRDELVTAATAATRSLFAHYDAMVESPSADASASKGALQMLGRILRMVLPSLGRVVAVRDDAAWWIEQALRLVVRPDAPVSVSIAATRFVRSAISLCGDRIFDLDVALRGIESARTSRVALGRDLPSILIERVGALVSLLPSALDDDNGSDDVDDSSAQFCVVVFQSDETAAKIGVAIEKVAAPDIRHLNMQLEGPESSATAAPVKIAESETASASMIHRSVRCDGCEMSPLRGYRFKCFTCPNYDLCAECYTGEKHDLDHEFIRLSDSSSGMGDVLQPRSKGGGTVPESSLVGSKHWKGSIVKVHVTTRGYALYRLGSAADCLATAKELAEIGCLATVMAYTELQAIDRVFGWECQLAASVEPGSARAGRRAAAAQKSSQQKADRATISAMNAAICAVRATHPTTRRVADVLALASEVIAAVRSVLSDRNDMRQWRNSTFHVLASALDHACELLEMPSLDRRECHRRYFEAIGVANVLGGFVEPLRVGGAVARVHGAKTESVRFGTLQSYALGNSVIQVCVPPALSARSGGDAARSAVVESAVSDVTPVSEIPLRVDVIKTLEHLAPSFCAVIKRLHGWLLSNKPGDSAQECLYRSELGCAFMRSFACMAPHWTSLFDNQIISTHGNIPALLFHLAQLCLNDVGLGSIESERDVVWQMEWVCTQRLQYALATRPIKRKSFSAVENADCIFQPPPRTESDANEHATTSSSETFYNLYAYSSRSDIPQHSGRNKLLEYWEKNVIPAIESYVSGSFKSYEMDYFFAQLREPLREGNSAAALKIAYTLCDGHVPSGCVYPDRDTDWSALQIDEVEVGGRYLISTETLDSSGWPQPMLWTVGHSGVVRLVNPSGMILLDVVNPVTSEMESWWYHVDSLKPCAARVRSFADHSVVDFDACGAQLLTMNKRLICSIARKSIFELLQVAPDHVMRLSIGRKATTAAATQRRPASSVVENRYSLSELLRLAATADLECPDKVAGLDGSYTESSSAASASLETSDVAVSARASPKHAHVAMLQSILNKHFDRPTVTDRAVLSPCPSDEVLPLISKKQTKPVKGASASSASLKASSQPKLSHQPDAEPPASPGKYRYMLMEALLHELKQCLDASSAFLQASSFSVASESPPKPVALVHVPGATCLVLSFVVHPVLMDLPPGSSLEFFRDEKCTDRIFGYFGEKKGLNYLPPLVVAGDRCYVKISQGLYARYKFRVDALTSDFGLALWIGEELYQKLLATPFSAYEVETLLSTLVSAFVEYLATATCLPCSAKIPVLQLVAKLVNFALGRGILTAVPITKLASPLVKELSAVVETERTTQHGRYSLYTQQLAELLALLEEVSSLKGASSSLVSGSWWTEYVRMAAFTRALVHGKREASSPEAFSRIYCGRSPIHEIDSAHRAVSTSDLYCERLILVQRLPKTARVDELRVALSRLVLHLSLEECGEADDQSVYSAAEVTRFGIVSQVLHLPVDDDGVTKGYAIVDVGREDIISNLLVRIPNEKLEFEGERTVDDADLAARIASRGAANSASSPEPADASQDEQVWSCSVCTLENSIAESECAACGSPIPPELATISRDLASQASSSSGSGQQSPPSADDPSSSPGWACNACTFLNSWDESSCLTCSLERSADQVPPASATSASPASESEQAPSGEAADGAAFESNVFHELSALRFSDALQVAETDDVPHVADFLRHVFVATAPDGSVRVVDAFVDVLRSEVRQSASSRESKQSIDAFTSLLELKCCCDDVGADAFIAQATARALDVVRTQPMDLFKWLRRAGYDLQFDLNHYATVDAARQAQAKWTFPMDCQLLAMCKALSASIGVLTLAELCPSHIRAKTHAHEHHLLAHLETRDLRLRFAVLKALNRLLLHALPLVNLRPWSDPNALRSRIVSIRQLVFPGVKIRFFAQTQDHTSLGCGISAPESGTKRPMVTLDRRKIFGRRALDAPLSLADPKRSLFASTMAQLSTIPPSQLRAKRPTGASDPFVAFIVLFAGENVVGEGGPYRQLFHDIASELLSPGNALFIPTPNNATKIGEYRERYIPKPSSTSKELLGMFEFVGLLMGCSLRTGVRLNIRLAPIVWKMLVKQSLAFTDLESVDYSLCESLKYLEAEAADSSLAPSDVLYESFTATRSDGTVVELKPHGRHIPVTKDNCKEYIRLVKASRLQECKPQVDAMLRGIGKIVPVQLLQLCVWTELQQWICGSLDINVELLKRHTRYASGMSPDKFPHLEMFWRVLAGFSEENKRRFINFAWGQDTLPADDAEFDRTHTRLLIKAPPTTTTGTSHDALLPKADTCFFNIELPAYSSDAVMREKLLLAITLCTSLDGDDQTGHVDIYYAGGDGEE